MISIIIPTYNERQNLEACLESLGLQTYGDFEVIVVDDGSTDNTWKLLSEIRNSKFEIRKFHAEHGGAGAARNLGASKAKGKILVFVDADMTFDKDFLKKLTAPIEKGRARGTFSKEEYVANWDNVWATCWNINEGWEPKRRHPKNYSNHQPVFRAILKSEFDRVGGFTPGGYDDDWSLYKKLGYEAVSADGAIFYHKNPEDLVEIFDQAKWAGKRKYKFGYLGYLGGLIRAFFPTSLVIGMYKGFKIYDLRFTIFKIVYDFGIFVGILEYLFTKKGAK
ncbi:MAG: hypothetical protein UT58_C0010G0012 [Microgenomates group bacterium GW2011_GWC1_39_7b]|uniref:Glycosyltransferase 2-like domain-containing protein n=3 Tax=Candidatus Woeseibacteriota TaxID=1752722 RepID=A0A0G0LUW6_9BACT|nr:MAG: hypothetical protein UT17_C0004G0138 [Candidatus Woesebacteria bacterium GW2011_GWB1_39_10]KKR26578.1 MAG: hypothetical protein UT58_C0010G0012 [Microgenomates group bacterium GW2011_GWC1_39_7b]KKR74399.1 MAG: hypothetical protein UU16_C0001G0050 [Candidatus Woesebacteria bacterium GW2011_GWA2_40_7]KKS90781.1 MAG: hypothetical protein UV66_C0001G0138 [Candidatus Woesebacteria bacterium GW2011_GWA1_43_12]